jgi:hypothetical protein
MKRLNSAIFGDVVQPESIDELFALLHELPSEKTRVRMWRGQGDISWPLHSTAYRRLASCGKPVTETDVVNYETHLLRYATHRGYRTTNGRVLSDQELLARLRHHGAATRLVDATRSAITALWFAAADQINSTGALIGMHCHYLGGYEGEPESHTYEELVGKVKDRAYPLTWEPNTVSPRVAAQHSQFLVSRLAASPAGSLELPSNPGATLVLALTPALKREALDVLVEVYDVRAITLFPDFDGFCTANAWSVHIGEMQRW